MAIKFYNGKCTTADVRIKALKKKKHIVNCYLRYQAFPSDTNLL